MIQQIRDIQIALDNVQHEATRLTHANDDAVQTIAAQKEVIEAILAEAEFVADAHAPFTTWIAEKCRKALS